MYHSRRVEVLSKCCSYLERGHLKHTAILDKETLGLWVFSGQSQPDLHISIDPTLP